MEEGWRSIEDDDDVDSNEDTLRKSFFSIHESWNESTRSSLSIDSTPTEKLRRQHQQYLLKQLKLLNPLKIQQFAITNTGEYVDEYYQERQTHVIANFFKGRDRIEKNQKSYFNQFDIIYEGYLYKKGTKYKLWEQSWKKRYCCLRRDIHCLTMYISKTDLTLVGIINISKDLKIGYDDNEDYTIFIQNLNEERYYLKGESEMDINKWKMEIRILSKSEKIPYNWWSFLFNASKSGNESKVSNIDSNMDSDDIVRMSSKSNNDHYADYTTASYDKKTYDDLFSPSVIRDQNINNFPYFENNNSIIGFIITAKLCHVVNENDSVFAMVKSKFLTSDNNNNDKRENHVLCHVSCTEIRIIDKQVINEDAVYGIDTVRDCTIQFDLIQNFPPTAIGADVIIFKIERTRDLNGKENRKNIELCSVYITTNTISNISNVFSIPMKILEAPIVDLTNPIQVEGSASLGLIRIQSELLFRQKITFKRIFKINPYSQMLYSFKTIKGFTLSLEQIYASFYTVLSQISYSDMIINERSKDLDNAIDYVLSKLAETEPYYKNIHSLYVKSGRNTRVISSELSIEDKNDLMTSINLTQKLIVSLIDYKTKYTSAVSNKKILSEKAVRLALGSKNEMRESLENVISYDLGGSIMKRSIWRGHEDSNFLTNNLNVHIVSSVAYQYSDFAVDSSTIFDKIGISTDIDDTDAFITPLITFGCPTAHTLKFKDGGLRNLLLLKKNDKALKNIYLWIHLIQAVSSPEQFISLLLKLPNEASSIFGSLDNLDNVQVVSNILMKKMLIAERLDIVTNQMLGFAVTAIKTIVSLASKIGGVYSFVLARSLKIGFLVSIQSLLSTNGKELGMIEDLDIAVKWLRVITIRLVTKPESLNGTNDDQFQIPRTKTLDGVDLRRDSNTNRLIVDIYIDRHEASTVASALKFMSDINLNDEDDVDLNYLIVPALLFDYNPCCTYSKEQMMPEVVAVTKLHGVLFTQGINEMQSLANLSFSNEVLRQVEINNEYMDSLKNYHSKYLIALKYQLDRLIGQIDQDDLKDESQSPNVKRNKSKTAIDEPFYRVLDDSKKHLQEIEQCIDKATSSPWEKHVDILTKISSLCLDIGGIHGLLCKSGKDRTSMSASFEHTKGLVERLGVIHGRRVCSTLRTHGVRRMNVLSNIGRPYYAFNVAQKNFLPKVYQPPNNTYKKGES